MAWRLGALERAVATVALCVITASHVSAQQPAVGVPADRPEAERPQNPPAEAPPILQGPATLASYPLELLGLLGPKRGGITLTPAIFLSEEYNDNINSDNLDRQWDFITNIGPALTLIINRPTYQLTAGYSNTSKIYAVNSEFDQLFASHNFVGNAFYQATPGLTLTASDSFTFQKSGVVAGFTTGRTDSVSNDFSLGTTWQMSAVDTLTLSGNYSLLRFQSSNATDSDTYGFRAGYGHGFTRLFSANINYKFEYINLQQGLQDSTTQTPTVGFSYRVTPTFNIAIAGGAAITQLGNETLVGPAGSAHLLKIFSWGSASLQYTRDVDVAGGFGGPTDLQTISATLAVSTLARNLILVLTPSYNISDSLSNRQAEQVDAQSFTLLLGALYQFNPYTSMFAGYSFFRQRTGQGSTRQVDVDQNIVRVGVQFGYPFHFD